MPGTRNQDEELEQGVRGREEGQVCPIVKWQQ